jgi:hypothetical protein
VLGCLGGDSPQQPHYFDPAPDEDVLEAFRRFVARLVEQWRDESDPRTVSLLAAARLLTGDLDAADDILKHLPAEPVRLDHGAGQCLVAPAHALASSVPWPAECADTSRWRAGSPEHAALTRWLEANRSKLAWRETDGVYELGA